MILLLYLLTLIHGQSTFATFSFILLSHQVSNYPYPKITIRCSPLSSTTFHHAYDVLYFPQLTSLVALDTCFLLHLHPKLRCTISKLCPNHYLLSCLSTYQNIINQHPIYTVLHSIYYRSFINLLSPIRLERRRCFLKDHSRTRLT